MLYSVKYKIKNRWCWKTVENVKSDSMESFLGSSHLVLIKEDDSLLMIPVEGLQVIFSKERHSMILENQKKQEKA